MSSVRKSLRGSLIVVLVATTQAIATAVPIVIVNPGFEAPLVNPAFALTLAGTPVDFWYSPDYLGGGQWDIGMNPYGSWTDVQAPEGNQILYIGAFRGPNYYEQTVAHIIQANATYTLTGFVGDPEGYQTMYTVDLRAGDNVLASVQGLGQDGSFEQFQVQFDSADSPFVGMPLTIRLSSADTQTAFDDLHLDGPAAPHIAGDYDGNLKVNGKDFLIWQQYAGLNVTPIGGNADGNADGVIDGLDLTLWKNHYGDSAALAASSAVPEPAALAMAALAAAMSLVTLHRRK
jgi:hypothetical protein